MIAQYKHLSLSVLSCKVIGIELFTSISDDVFLITLQPPENNIFSVIKIDAKSPLLHTAPHIITQTAYEQGMSFLQFLHAKFNGVVSENSEQTSTKSTFITQTFAIAKKDNQNDFEGELYEGRIYDVNENALENPFQVIIHVCLFILIL